MNTTANRRYVLQDMLGQGGMGTVSRAQDRLSKQLIALKRIKLQSDPRHDTPGSDFQVALSNEFRVLASLRHPHIIKVLDKGWTLDSHISRWSCWITQRRFWLALDTAVQTWEANHDAGATLPYLITALDLAKIWGYV